MTKCEATATPSRRSHRTEECAPEGARTFKCPACSKDHAQFPCGDPPLVGGGCGRDELDGVNHALAFGFAFGAIVAVVLTLAAMHVVEMVS